jgi:HSP20 family protein
MSTMPAPYERPWPEAVRWAPRAHVSALACELDRLFGDLARLDPFGSDGPVPVDVHESDEAYVYELDLPGVDRRDLVIEVQAGRLSVRGERRESASVGVWRRRGRVTGRFAYVLALPDDVEWERTKARLEAGVLTLSVPKGGNSRVWRVPVRQPRRSLRRPRVAARVT